MTLPLLAARLAGGFVSPASQEVLYLAIRQALEAGGYEDIGKVSELPGMPAAAPLRDWWNMDAPASFPDNARLRDFVLLERRVRDELPSGMLTPPDLVKAALARIRFAPKVLGAVTIQDVPNIQAVWHPLVQALCDVVPVRWIASKHSRRDWFSGDAQTRPSGTALLGSADLCADPRNEVRESLRWARALVADGKAAPHEVAISAASPSAWDDAFLVLSREAGMPVHFTHGIPALATREGQACAALADILLRGLSQERVRLLFARLPRSPAKENLPSDWAKGLRRSAALTSPTLWRHALEQTRDERANGDLAERALLPILEDLAGGIASAEGVGRRLLMGPALSLWRDALRMAPPQAIELSLQALRVADGRDPGNSIAWGSARHVAAAPRAYVRLIGLDANAWPRRSSESPLLPQHLIGQLQLPSAEAAESDQTMHDIIVGQSANYTLSRAYRSATGSLQAASTLWPKKEERVVGRSAIPSHAFSESDRLYARPVDAGKDPQVRASRACWRAWWDGEQHTAHDGKVRADHPLVVDALVEVQSTTSLHRLLCDPLGFVWEYALHWREPNLDSQPLALDHRAFGELVHALIGGVLRNGAPKNIDEISLALDREVARLNESWPITRAVPPGLLWRHTLEMARERALRGLGDALGEPRGRSWTELSFGEPSDGPHPWTTLSPVPIGKTGVVFRGRIDRLDEDAARGAAVVTDYKVGMAPERKKPVVFDRGAELQRVFYGLAVRFLLSDVRSVSSQLTYLKHDPARTLSLANEELEKAIDLAAAFTAAGVHLQRNGQIAPGPAPVFFDPLAVALPADLDSYRRVKRRLFAQANSALDKLWSSP
ncbi:PD-(D/E)XK nuclease family protein [Bradyrhizobium barranii subsp. apii]|uniref:PD-(D/E)XK nuclease family protein n=1 Tax=Bradyrhizobium barranii subsp. apii TaxID=2819348 RepID=A0A8T5VHX8_9BRAD|nr:PD-(D/E)XK nuclease family protein [Bradyrhizobium barranii]UPT89807.1 PD-(D/E)XK nuclease family protein [Bradyrhizobium barranii subsp. apii]